MVELTSELSVRAPEAATASGGRPGGPRLSWWPGLGGKVTSLRFGEYGREWLAPPVRPLAAPAPGQDWGELDCSGWDECLPNLGASAADGLADHGDVWRYPWTVVPGAACGSVAPPHREYRFARDITAQDSTLRIEYRLENVGGRPLDWAWAQHLLLAADERTRIVSSAPMRFRVDGAFEAAFPAAGFDWLAPDVAPAVALDLAGAVGRAAKLWFEPPLPAVVAVVNGEEWLAWRIAESSFPHLGLWVNLGGWGDLPLRHLALEPAFGAHDRPADAYPDLDPLAAGESRTWRVVIEAGVGAPALRALLSTAERHFPEQRAADARTTRSSTMKAE